MSGIDRSVRQARASLRAAGQLAATVRKDPRILADLVGGLFGAAESQAANLGDYLPPAGVADFVRQTHASVEVPAAADSVAAYLADPNRFGEWLTTHVGWRGDPPTALDPGATFVQQGKFMGIPADIRWTVAGNDGSVVELQGAGPMGLTVGFWLTTRSAGATTTVYFDAGLSGQPIEGPMGASVVRSLGEAMAESLGKLPAAIAAAGPISAPGARRAPVLHHASGRTLPPNTPVIVGVGQVTQRAPAFSKDPAALAVQALRRAGKDSGAGESLLRSADAVYSVASASWQYRDMGSLVADALDARRATSVQSSPFGGDGAQVMINSAAQAVMDGELDVVLLAGAEAGATLAAAAKTGVDLHWPEQGVDVTPAPTIGTDRAANNESEARVGLGAPIYMYALLESANRRVLGRAPKEHTEAISELWSRYSSVAAANENAWQPEEFDAAAIATPAESNRLISAPYTKLLCANLQVDMASGIILCSVAAAEAAGVPQDKWVFLHAGASAYDEWFVSERAELAASPAINAIGASALRHSGIDIDDVKHVDLYACFPSAVQIAARELGLDADDPTRPLTVTGGLTFGGGPGNNYGSHAVATLVGRLREDPSSFGLSTSLGWYVTKHAIGIYSATPPQQDYRYLQPIVDNPPSRPARSGYRGPAVVEAYTVPFDRDGGPEAGILSVLTPGGERVLVRTTQPEIVAELVDGDALGLPVTVLASDELTIDSKVATDLPEPPPAPVLVERRGAVTVITLNRPHVRNAVDLATATALERAIDAFEADPDARVAILTGAGGSFCSGMDLKAAARGEYPLTEKRGPLGISAKPPSKPLIAAVEGPALAGGCELALSADLIVAANNSQFGIPEPKRGLVAAGGGVMRLRERLPRNIAMELALTGDPMQATRLADLGLVNRLAEPGKALDVALELAEQIAVNAPLSLAASKRIVDESADWTHDEGFDKQTEIAATALFSDDATEGVRAFAEKRNPVWRGR
ncbi:crotonase/enoyl-CoA hydratase family protein [Antrihabitans sp. NCIMB 15449]|uniref:Crotonase/enoyl-CoA hydratase family protein n=1 Tax=Antrihabitans spumae TaxID=3373370 RepID=A0ABW7JSY8_9NOCA